jgi:hypothetical protein
MRKCKLAKHMYKKFLNAKPSPDGSPEHVYWTTAAATCHGQGTDQRGNKSRMLAVPSGVLMQAPCGHYNRRTPYCHGSNLSGKQRTCELQSQPGGEVTLVQCSS